MVPELRPSTRLTTASCTSRWPDFIAIGVIVAVWAFNIFGIRPMKGLTYVTAGLLMLVLICLHVRARIISGALAFEQRSRDVPRSVGRLRSSCFVYLFILGWSSWACEVCATFAPEYKTQRDTQIAMRSSAIFVVGVFILAPARARRRHRRPVGRDRRRASSTTQRVPDDRRTHGRHDSS